MFTKIKKYLKEWGVLSFPSSKGIVIPREYVDKTSGKLIQNIETVLNKDKDVTMDKFCKSLQPLLPELPDSIGVLGCKVLPKSNQYPSDSIYIGLDTDIVDSSFDKLEQMLRQKNNQF